jgi:hypothetical protein
MFSMTTVLLSRRLIMNAARVRSLSDRLLHCATLVSAVSSAALEGLRKAEQYYTLAHSSDQRGLSSAELLRFIMFVKH